MVEAHLEEEVKSLRYYLNVEGNNSKTFVDELEKKNASKVTNETTGKA